MLQTEKSRQAGTHKTLMSKAENKRICCTLGLNSVAAHRSILWLHLRIPASPSRRKTVASHTCSRTELFPNSEVTSWTQCLFPQNIAQLLLVFFTLYSEIIENRAFEAANCWCDDDSSLFFWAGQILRKERNLEMTFAVIWWFINKTEMGWFELIKQMDKSSPSLQILESLIEASSFYPILTLSIQRWSDKAFIYWLQCAVELCLVKEGQNICIKCHQMETFLNPG